jgi:hypothetical protein
MRGFAGSAEATPARTHVPIEAFWRRRVAGIHAVLSRISKTKDVDGRDKPGHDERTRRKIARIGVGSRIA